MRFVKAGVVVLLAGFCGFQLYSTTGFVGVTKKPGGPFSFDGCICHNDSSSVDVRVWIEGPDSVQKGVEAIYRLSVVADSAIAAGFNVAAFFGSLGVAESSATQLLPVFGDSLELTHTEPRPATDSDTISWMFFYRAPLTAGIVDTLYSVANMVDMSFDPTGDHWNFGDNFLVHVTTGPVSVVEQPPLSTFRLMQNYPNPFNPSTTIRYTLFSRSHVNLKVYDITGRIVGDLVNEVQESGDHSLLFSPHLDRARAYSSGVYLYRILVTPVDASQRRTVGDVGKMVMLQ
jgi:hypothetical protein